MTHQEKIAYIQREYPDITEQSYPVVITYSNGQIVDGPFDSPSPLLNSLAKCLCKCGCDAEKCTYYHLGGVEVESI